MSKVLELFGVSTTVDEQPDWRQVVLDQVCPYLNRTCLKTRKSTPQIAIGTCSVRYGRDNRPIIICPYRLLERRQIFTDCLHLLSLHEPGNELHVVSEITIPGGSVDYFLVSVRDDKVKDFVGVELQTLDTTGTVWPERQRFLQEQGFNKDAATTARCATGLAAPGSSLFDSSFVFAPYFNWSFVIHHLSFVIRHSLLIQMTNDR